MDAFLASAAARDPRAAGDVRRLRRLWAIGAPPPARWTVRWAPEALADLAAWAGLDVLRWIPGGARVDLSRLAAKLGGAASLERGLDRFLAGLQRPAPVSKGIPEGSWRSETRRWLEAIPPGRSDSDDIAHVARALDRIVHPERNGAPIHASVLGAWVGAASKYFRPGSPGRRRLADALLSLKGLPDRTDPGREAALEEAGVIGSDTAYAVLAAGHFSVQGLDFPARLAERGQAAFLTLQNLSAARTEPGVEGVLTIENEAPFLAALGEGLHRRWVLVLTGGYPNRAVRALFEALASQTAAWRHWGDTDLAGVRIARTLAERTSRPPDFFRCAPDDVRRWRSRLIPLGPAERKAVAADLRDRPSAPGSDVLRTVLAEGGWLEQEAWQTPTPDAR